MDFLEENILDECFYLGYTKKTVIKECKDKTMSNKMLIGGIVVVVVLGGVWLSMKKPAQAPTGEQMKASEQTAPKTVTSAPEKTAVYTMEEIAKHADRSSCWAMVRGNVYDLTGAIDKHPGGPEAVLAICGKDGTGAFVGKHGGMEKPEAGLESAKIGTLAQ
jgi:predicted heme/steroid binding protein